MEGRAEVLPEHGSGRRWGPLFGARARDWAASWEGPAGWGTAAYAYVLSAAGIGPGTRVLDCGCGAGRFARLAADRGARVAGVDASTGLLAVAAERTPGGDFRVADLEALPWADRSFDVVTGFSSFQFADDKVRAMREAGRVSAGRVAVVVPSRPADSGVAAVLAPLVPLFPPGAVERLRQSGIFALSAPGVLESTLAAAGLVVEADEEVDGTVVFPDAASAVRAFLGAGPTALAVGHSGEAAVADALRAGLVPLTAADGTVRLPASFRCAVTHP